MTQIEKWLKAYDIENYTINTDLTVDVDGSVEIGDKGLTKLPFQFGNVTGYFDCSFNKLTSLRYCPKIVGMGFDCQENQLTSLRYCPKIVRGNFYCQNNRLAFLRHCPKIVGGYFICANNRLTSLRYFPKNIGGDFYLSHNPFTVTKENEREWMGIIENHKGVYYYIDKPTEALTSFYKMIYEL